MIPYGQQSINQADVDAVVEVLRSEFLTQGSVVPAFEKAVASHCGANHAVAVSSATSALHVACLALGLRSGDWLWTSPNTFVASANCGLYCGANVDFVDIDPQTYNLCVDALISKLEIAEKENRLPKVLIAVHFAGQSCDMARISELAEKYSFSIIEDGTHALGGAYKGQAVGNCCYSDITVFSFHPVKIITTGEGGMALTNNEELANYMMRLRTHGITRDISLMTHEAHGPWYYEQVELGFNYRMTDIQAALGISQLSRLDDFVSRRNQLAQRYDEAFVDFPIQLQLVPRDVYSARHLNVVRVSAERHLEIFQRLRTQGIGVSLHYIPVHLQPYYRRLGFTEGNFPHAESYYREAISLPMFAALSESSQERVITVFHQVIHS